MRRLFIDIETSPNVALIWRPGYNLTVGDKNIVRERAVICVGWKWQNKPVQVATWDKNQSDCKLLERVIPIISDADEVVSHNGNKFDLPWLRGRALFHGLALPVVRMVDTLKWARRYYNFNSNRLDYLGRFLKIGQKTEHAGDGFDLWKDVLLDNDRKALARMADYCCNDVVGLLQPIWERMSLTCPVATHAGVAAYKERWTCPHCASDNVKETHRRVTAKGTPQYAMQCGDCHGFYSISSSVKKQYVEDNKAA